MLTLSRPVIEQIIGTGRPALYVCYGDPIGFDRMCPEITERLCPDLKLQPLQSALVDVQISFAGE
jgi:hypothetical protein